MFKYWQNAMFQWAMTKDLKLTQEEKTLGMFAASLTPLVPVGVVMQKKQFDARKKEQEKLETAELELNTFKAEYIKILGPLDPKKTFRENIIKAFQDAKHWNDGEIHKAAKDLKKKEDKGG